MEDAARTLGSRVAHIAKTAMMFWKTSRSAADTDVSKRAVAAAAATAAAATHTSRRFILLNTCRLLTVVCTKTLGHCAFAETSVTKMKTSVISHTTRKVNLRKMFC